MLRFLKCLGCPMDVLQYRNCPRHRRCRRRRDEVGPPFARCPGHCSAPRGRNWTEHPVHERLERRVWKGPRLGAGSATVTFPVAAFPAAAEPAAEPTAAEPTAAVTTAAVAAALDTAPDAALEAALTPSASAGLPARATAPPKTLPLRRLPRRLLRLRA